MTEYVYLVFHPKSGAYKIGRSKRPAARLKQLAPVACGLAVVGVIATTVPVWLEKTLHQVFAHRRVRKEWFALSQEEALLVLSVAAADSSADLPEPMMRLWRQNEATGFRTTCYSHPSLPLLPGVTERRSKYMPKPAKSKAIRVDWDESNRDSLNLAAAKCDLSHAAFARVALELLVTGKAVSLASVKAEADRQIKESKKND